MNAPTTLDEAWCLDVVWSAAKPRARITVSEWADQHRILTSKQSGEPGRWRTSRNPPTREIMDCFSPGSRVSEVVLMCPAQWAKTEIIINVLASNMDQAPGPMMVLNPTIESTKAWKTQKWNPVMTDTPVIRDLLGGQRMRDATNTQEMIDFPGGVLFLAGGNSPNSYAMRSVRLLAIDDADRFPRVIAKEGSPIFLARQRLNGFRNSKLLIASSPTEEDDSIIYTEYRNSDQRRCWIPCPYCGEFQTLEWGTKETPYGIKWNSRVTEAVYVCRHCGVGIAEHHKGEMLEAHRWIAANPGNSRRGYQISRIYSPLGLGDSWLDMVHAWRMAQDDTDSLQAFINTNLGEVWKGKGEGVDPLELLKRLEPYTAPPPALVRTVGIDVQKNRIEISVLDIGPNEETWYDSHHIIEGDTAGPEPWAELGDLIAELRPDCGGIDSGYNTDQVVAFARHYPWLFVCKGIEGRGKTLIEDDVARKQRLRRKRKKGVSPFLVSNHAGMALITQRLALPLPEASDGPAKPAPGVIHFPRAACFDDEFFAQLASNKLEEKTVRGKRVTEWKERKPNEAYDCWKYGIAGFRLSKIDPARRAVEKSAAAQAGSPMSRALAARLDRHAGGAR